MLNENNYKMVMIYINESHKKMLEDFLDKIHFYLYTVQKKVESVWSERLKHKNNNVWPGTDCIFILTVPEKRVEKLLSQLKTFRASLNYELIMSIGIIPLERTIPDLLNDNSIDIDEKLLEEIKNK